MRLAVPRMNPEDIGSTSAAVFYCAPSTLRFDTTINYQRCAVSFLMPVKWYRRLIFYVHNFSAGKFAAFRYESGKLWSWRSPSAYQAFHHWMLNSSCTIFFFTIDLNSKNKDICPFVRSYFSSAFLFYFFVMVLGTYRNKVWPWTATILMHQ